MQPALIALTTKPMNQPSVGTSPFVASWNSLVYAAHGSVQSSCIIENSLLCQTPSHLSCFSGVSLHSDWDQLLLRSNNYNWWRKKSQFPEHCLHKSSTRSNIEKRPCLPWHTVRNTCTQNKNTLSTILFQICKHKIQDLLLCQYTNCRTLEH